VIFREMFPSGLTLLDLREEGVDAQMSMSHVAARAEVRALLDVLNLPLSAGRAAAGKAAAPQSGEPDGDLPEQADPVTG